jgi:dCMP deaminase
MIIGLTGSLAAGKGVVSDFLRKKGFVYLSLSDELREILKENKIQITRENLQIWGNKLREEKGSDVLAKRVFGKIKSQEYKKAVVDGIRNPAEVEFLGQNLREFFLVAVDAPKNVRFERMISRNRESDPISWEKFILVDEKDQGIGEKEFGQGVGKCMAMAKFVLINDGSLEEVEMKIEKLYSDICSKIPPMSWDEYFMTFALVAARKSKDPSTKVGACIVDKEKRVVGLGYNGFPRKCDDEKFPLAREGEYLDTKYAYVVHAEPNAILNSTKETRDCKIYVTLFPCNECAKLIIQAGIVEVIYLEDKYADSDAVKASKKLFDLAGVKTRRFGL